MVIGKEETEVRLDGQGIPLWLCMEVTYRCPLQCPWCNNPLDYDTYRKHELSTDEWFRVLHEGREMGALQIGLTGGEPMMRDDIVEITAEAGRLGYYTNLITGGIGLTKDKLEALKEAGLNQIQLSIQSCDPAITNKLIGADAHDKKMQVARDIKALDFPLSLNVPVCRESIDQTKEILDMCEEVEADYLEYVQIQYYNWALHNRDELLPTKEQVKRSEQLVNEARERLGKKMTIYFVVPDYHDKFPKACMNGWGAIHLTIAPDGTAMPCQEARAIKEIDFPSVRDHDLSWIWHESPAFNLYRGEDWMKEPCRSCDDKEKDVGGCRCQAYLLTGDATNTDPVCYKSPHHYIVEEAITEASRPGRNTLPYVMRSVQSAASMRE